jgi:serine/threonine protein kinase
MLYCQENVLVDREGSPYLAGLGLTTVRRSGAITEGGSTRWMAPELFMNSEGNTVDLEDSVPTLKATCYSDIWSFAMLALELLTGKIPFPDKYPNATVMYALINGERPKQPQRRSSTENGLNNELWGYLLRCWNPSPQNRLPLQSLYDVLDRLATQWRPVAQILGMSWHWCPSICRRLTYLTLQGPDSLQPYLLSTSLRLKYTTQMS